MPYDGDPINVEGATCTLASDDVGGSGTTDATINTNVTTEELEVWGDYPYTHAVAKARVATGTVNFIADQGTVTIEAGTDSRTLVIAATGFLFTANVIVDAGSIVLGGPAAKSSFSFRSIGTYTITTGA